MLNPESTSPRSQGIFRYDCAAPLRRTALTRMHGKNVIHVPTSPVANKNERIGLENQLDSPVQVAWSVQCDSPPVVHKPPKDTPGALPSEPALVETPLIQQAPRIHRRLAPRRTLALTESDTALCTATQGNPCTSSPLNSPREAKEPKSTWRATWTLQCDTPLARGVELATNINGRKHSLVERLSPSAETMGSDTNRLPGGLKLAVVWAARAQHESEPSSPSTAGSPCSHRSSCEEMPEHGHEAAPPKRRCRADRVAGAERMAEGIGWSHNPLRPPSATRSRRPSFDGDLALVTPLLTSCTPPLGAASATKTCFSLEVETTPTFDDAMSDDVPPCASAEPRAREVWNLLVQS